MLKKVFAILLCLTIALSAFQVPVFAEEADEDAVVLEEQEEETETEEAEEAEPVAEEEAEEAEPAAEEEAEEAAEVVEEEASEEKEPEEVEAEVEEIPAEEETAEVKETPGELEAGEEPQLLADGIDILSNCKFYWNENGYTYTGKQIKPEVVITYNGAQLTKDVDYQLYYDTNIEAGTGYFYVYGIGRFTNQGRGSFTIDPATTNKVTTSEDSWSIKAKPTKEQTIKLGAKAKYGQMEFSSSKSAVKVSDKGVVTIPKDFAGKVTITIKVPETYSYPGFSKKVTITVKKVAATKIKMPKTKKVAAGFKVTIKPTMVYKCQKLSGAKWSTSDKKIATVNSKGVVTGKKPGKVKITCKLPNGKKYTCTVTVKKNKIVNMKYSKIEDSTSIDAFGHVNVYLLDAYYSGKNLVLDLGVYNYTLYYAKYFNYINFTLYLDGKEIKTYTKKDLDINLASMKKKKIAVKIPMKKVYNLTKAKSLQMDCDGKYTYIKYY